MKCSHDTALRDIEDLIKKKALTKDAAGGRSTSYSLAKTPEAGAKGRKSVPNRITSPLP